MADGGRASVLRRKLDAAQAASEDARTAGTPGRALADALRRAVEAELSVSVVPGDPRDRRLSAAELMESLPDHPLLSVLLGPEDGTGLCVLDAGSLSAVIEARTMGRIGTREAQARRPTRTDAALVCDLVDRVLAEFEAPLAAGPDARWARGWRYQLHLPEARSLPIVLEDAPHRVFEVDLVWGAAARPGRLVLALPLPGRGRPVPAPDPPAGSVVAQRRADWRSQMQETVGSAALTLDAVLGRLRLPLSALAGLAPGDRIALPATALGAVQLVGAGGAPVAEGRLGQSGGARALKLAPNEDRPVPRLAEGRVIPAGEGGAAFAPPIGDLDPGLTGGLARTAWGDSADPVDFSPARGHGGGEATHLSDPLPRFPLDLPMP